MKNIETLTVDAKDCITKNNADFINMGQVDKVIYDDEFDCKCIKYIYETTNQRITEMFNTFNTSGNPPLQLPESDYQKVEFITCSPENIKLVMKNDVVTDEFSILRDTLNKQWYKFSNKRQVVKVYSKLSQSGFMNVAKK
jgi:hypothetical protein